MSIPLADAAHAIVKLPPPTETTSSVWFSTLIFGWCLIALFFAKLLGVFRRRSIVGPPRMAAHESPWLLVFILLSGIFFGSLFGNLLGRFIRDQSQLNLLTQGIIEALAVSFIVAMSAFYRSAGLALLGLRSIRIPRGIALGATTIFILYPLVLLIGQLTELVLHLAGYSQTPPHEVIEALGHDHSARFIATAIILVVIIAPFFEELAFRGCLQTAIARFFLWLESPGEPVSVISPSSRSRWLAVIITAAIFAASHHEPGFFPPLFLLALGLGYVYERTGNLWATITAHALFNAIQLLFFLGQSWNG